MKKKAKILYVITSLNLGGAEKHLLQLLPNLDKEKFEISVFPMRGKGSLEKAFEKKDIKIIKSKSILKPPFHILTSAPKLIKIIKKTNPDIVHFFLPEAYVIGGLCGIIANAKNMIMSRRSMNYYQEKHPFATRLEHWLHSKMKLLLGNSSVVCKQLEQEAEKGVKIKKIYNGIEIKEKNKSIKETRAELGIKEDELVFVNVSNLIFYKGHIDLINAFSLIKEKINKDFKLVLVGDGTKEYKQRLKELIEKKGLEKNILMPGSKDDVFDILRASDIKILSSHEEGFSNAILEAMSQSLPVIATNVGGNAEAVMNSINGYVTPPKSIEKMAEKILKLANDETLQKKMGQNSKALFEKSFTIEKCVLEYEKTYSQILNN